MRRGVGGGGGGGEGVCVRSDDVRVCLCDGCWSEVCVCVCVCVINVR